MGDRTCYTCKEKKPLSLYYKYKEDKHFRDCKECFKAIKKNRDDIAKKWVGDYKIKKGCKKCGYSMETHKTFAVSALEFHHPRGDKSFAISTALSQGAPLERIKDEIKKCIVLCSRCHSEIHHGLQ
jgi:hypothetical protein